MGGIEAPEKEVLKLDQVRNQITASEAEVKRLSKLRVNEEYQVGELLKAKKYHADEIAKLEARETELQAELDKLADDYTAAKETIAKQPEAAAAHKASLKELEAAQTKFTAEHSDALNQLEDRRVELDKRREALDDREAELATQEQVVQGKVAKLEAIVAELKG
jgi:chromosome segregation ATPase